MPANSKKKMRSTDLTEETKKSLMVIIEESEKNNQIKLPSEEELAELVGVSRITIRSALNELQSEGLIFRKQGKGTFINPQALKIKVQLSPVLLFKDMIAKSGFTPSVKIMHISKINASDEIAKLLDLEPQSIVYLTKKMFYANNQPCAYCIDYFSEALVDKELTMDDLNSNRNSIFEYLYEHFNIDITWDKTEIQTVTNLEVDELSNAFELGSRCINSFLLLKSVNYTENSKAILYAEEYINTDFINFSMIRQKNKF